MTRHLHKITAPDQSPSGTSSDPASREYLRVTVSSGGCHGFQYQMSLDRPENVDQEEDTVFAYEPGREGGGDGHEDGHEHGDPPQHDGGGARVVVDRASLEVLYGSTVDYTQELIGSQFVIAGNPRATSSCGCGTSFDIA
ncbi:hypothetical protein KEM52_004622 [Ascosphaera acerosa]|nr:hypothetical protein KEM52_004622 [Ascosphaera acerosa]